MILYLLIFLALTYCAYRNWHRTVIAWMPIQLLINECVCLKYTSPAVSLVLAVDIMLLAFYYLLKPARLNRNGQYVFHGSFKFYLVSYGMSILFSIVPFTQVLTGTIKYFIETFIIVYLFQLAVRSMDDLRYLLKVGVMVMIPIVALGIYESATHDNPWLDYVWMNVPNKELIEGKMYYVPPFMRWSEEGGLRYGAARCFSTFNIHIAMSCGCVFMMLLYLFAYKYKEYFKLNMRMLFLAIGLAVVGTMLANSKTGMLGLMLFPLAAIDARELFRIRYIILFGVVIAVVAIYMPNQFLSLQALFDEKLAAEGGGSTVELRDRQFEVGLQMFAQNPIFGNGLGALSVMSKQGNWSDILGSESSWLKILPERGILGVFAYLYLYMEMLRKLRRFYPDKFVILFLAGLGMMETATGFMSFPLYGMLVVVFYRFGQFKLQSRKVKTLSA